MPRKRFEEQPYDPISADLVREVAAAGRLHVVPTKSVLPPAFILRPEPVSPPRPAPVVPSFTAEPAPRVAPASSRAIAPTSPLPPVPKAPAMTTITKRFVLTRAEDDELNAFVLRLQQRAGTKVTLSVLVRALVTVAMQAEAAVLRELDGHALRFPSTHDRLGQGFFEEQWQRCLTTALTTPVRSRG